jgi:spore germination protein YaaH
LNLEQNFIHLNNIGLAFLEILNYHSHQPRSIAIHLKENTVSEMMEGYNFAINMTQITLESYSTSTETPSHATIYVVENSIPLFTNKTKFNIIVTNTRKFSEQINADGITESEKSLLSSTDTALYVHRTSLRMNMITITRNVLEDNQKDTNFVRPIYLQNKLVNLTNINFRISGRLLRTLDPMNLHVENVDIDFYAAMGGFFMRIM